MTFKLRCHFYWYCTTGKIKVKILLKDLNDCNMICPIFLMSNLACVHYNDTVNIVFRGTWIVIK